jgi:hypothetical protein
MIMTTTRISQLVAAVWAASLAQNAVASIFGIFTGFWLSLDPPMEYSRRGERVSIGSWLLGA